MPDKNNNMVAGPFRSQSARSRSGPRQAQFWIFIRRGEDKQISRADTKILFEDEASAMKAMNELFTRDGKVTSGFIQRIETTRLYHRHAYVDGMCTYKICDRRKYEEPEGE